MIDYLMSAMSTKVFSVLTTVNAPYSTQLGAEDLAHALLNVETAKQFSGQVSSFLGEVSLGDQMEFAQALNIPLKKLKEFAVSFAEWSGESYQLAA